MRIISHFKDYYDIQQAFGIDKSIVYLRKPVRKSVSFDFGPSIREHWEDCGVESFVIGFAGKFYPVLVASVAGLRPTCCYSEEDYLHFVEKNKSEEYLRRYLEPNFSKPIMGPNRRWVQHFFEKAVRESQELFLKLEAPIFVYEGIRWGGGLGGLFAYGPQGKRYRSPEQENPKDMTNVVVNPCLREFQFFKVLSPQQAFQELSMYMGGLAAPSKPIPAIPDATMRDAKGFDKWSFKKEPWKHKR